MTKLENTYVVAMEECAELSKELSKAMRFGLDSAHPDHPDKTTASNIIEEYFQLCAVMDKLIAENIQLLQKYSESDKQEVAKKKIEKMNKWMENSIKNGFVE